MSPDKSGRIKMLAEFSMVPVGVGESISPYLAKAVKIIDESGLDYRVNSMSTIVEGDLDDVLGLIKKCHTVMMSQCNRVITTIVIDDRKDYTGRLIKKIESLEEKVGKKLKK